MAMVIDNELNAYIQLLNAQQKRSLLGFIKSLVNVKDGELEDVEAYNQELERSEAEIGRGDFYTHDQVSNITEKLVRGK